MFSYFIGQKQNLFYADYIRIVGQFILSIGIVMIMNVMVTSAHNAYDSLKNKEKELEETLHTTQEKILRNLMQHL